MTWERKEGRPGPGGTQRVRRTVVAGSTAVALGSAALAAGSAPPAEAWHQEALPPVLHSPDWRVCAAAVGGGRPILSVNHAIAQWDAHPRLTVTGVCSDMNVFIQATDFAEDWYGDNSCWVWRPDGDCDAVVISLNARILESTADPLFEWKQTACHEMGHTAALGHRDPDTTSCLANATVSVVADAHDFWAIDQTYPR